MVDTNFVIAYLRGNATALAVLRSLKTKQVSFSVVTYLEIVRGEALLERRKGASLGGFFKPYELLPLSPAAAQFVGREALRLGRGKTQNDLNDLAIAATAREYDRTVLTENLEDFKGVSGVRVQSWRDL